MPTIFETTKQALQALDFTEENARYAEIQAELESFTDAQEKIRARNVEIDKTLRDIRDLKSEDAAKAADRLLDSGDVTEIAKAVSTEQDLRDERASLNATFGELTRRHQDLYPEGSLIQGHCRAVAAQTAQPIVDLILAEAREAAERLAVAYAAIDAVSNTTRSRINGQQELKEAFEALRGLFHHTGGFPAMTIPEDIRETLLPLQNKGPAAPMHVPNYVSGFMPPAAPIKTERKVAGPSTLRSWLSPAWARATASITFPG